MTSVSYLLRWFTKFHVTYWPTYNTIQSNAVQYNSPATYSTLRSFLEALIHNMFITEVIVVVLYWTALHWNPFPIFCPPHVCKWGNVVQFNTTANFNFSNKQIAKWILPWQYKSKLSIIIFVMYFTGVWWNVFQLTATPLFW